jgi:hypothetical protein
MARATQEIARLSRATDASTVIDPSGVTATDGCDTHQRTRA